MSDRGESDLPNPKEFLELYDGQEAVIRPIEWSIFEDDIHPRGYPPGVTKRVKILRIVYDKDPNTPGLNYWDITSQRLMVQIHPILAKVKNSKKRLKIRCHGNGPGKHFQVSVIQ